MPDPHGSSLSLLRRIVVANLARPLPEIVRQSLDFLLGSLHARAALLARIDGDTLEVVDAATTSPPAIERGTRIPLEDSFAGDGDTKDGVVRVRDTTRSEAFRRLPMRRRFGIDSYLGVPVRSPAGRVIGTLAVVGKGPRLFSEEDADLLLVVAGLLGPRLEGNQASGGDRRREPRVPLPIIRLASDEVQQPLAILRGYADMLTRNEIPADQLPLVARRLAAQAQTLMRLVDQVLILSRLPLELAFSVRVSLAAVARAAAEDVRGQMEAAGMAFRLQLDAEAEVWGDATLLQAALGEMLHNVFLHAPGATTVQLRLRPSAPERFQLIVKDDGPGISAERLAELFAPLASEQEPRPGQGLGLHLVRQVAEAHGGSAWANSLEGKGTTFYMELPAASPDGDAVRASQAVTKSSA